MAIKRIKFWMGDQGPFLMKVDSNKPQPSPFRWENQRTSAIERVTTEQIQETESHLTEHDSITGSEYSAFRAAHFNAFGSEL